MGIHLQYLMIWYNFVLMFPFDVAQILDTFAFDFLNGNGDWLDIKNIISGGNTTAQQVWLELQTTYSIVVIVTHWTLFSFN